MYDTQSGEFRDVIDPLYTRYSSTDNPDVSSLYQVGKKREKTSVKLAMENGDPTYEYSPAKSAAKTAPIS